VVTISDAPDPLSVGDQLTYTVVVTNNGPNDATGASLSQILPPGVSFVSATSAQGSCSEAGGVVSCSLGTLTMGQSTIITVVVTPTSAGTLTSTAIVSANESDPDLGNNANAAVTRVLGPLATPTATPTPTATETATPAETQTPTATPVFLCGTAPRPVCRNAQIGQLLLYAASDARRSTAYWKFQTGTAQTLADFGTPGSSTSYALCIYDTTANVANLAMRAFIPPGGTCSGIACWQSSGKLAGTRYLDKTFSTDGTYVLWLRTGGTINFQGNGIHLPVPAPVTADRLLRQDSRVVVQLLNSEGVCWQTTHSTPAQVNKKLTGRNGFYAYLFRQNYVVPKTPTPTRTTTPTRTPTRTPTNTPTLTPTP
jgi:uncharacterized repeat protein (TIGR01451 family)